MDKLNELAWRKLETTLPQIDALGIEMHKMECGTLVLDAGIHARGGMQAGVMMAAVGMSSLGGSTLEMGTVAGSPWPQAVTRTNHPYQACFLSQSAHWQIQKKDWQAMGSGPACLLNHEVEAGASVEYDHSPEHGVLILETSRLPDEGNCIELAAQCHLPAGKLAIIAARTSSLAGSVQIAARSIETGLHKLQHLGFDLATVVSGMGRCPVAPPTGNDLQSLGKTNDAVFYGCQVWLAVKGVQDETLAEVVQKVPASTSPSFGEPFLTALKSAGGFYNIDPGLFAPAEITLTNLDSGKVFHAGAVDEPRLRSVFAG